MSFLKQLFCLFWKEGRLWNHEIIENVDPNNPNWVRCVRCGAEWDELRRAYFSAY